MDGAEFDGPGERLKAARVKAGYATASAAATAFGWHPQNVRDHEAGRRGISPEQAIMYARAYRTTPGAILYGEAVPGVGESNFTFEPQMRLLPIVGEVQAGAWISVDEFDQTEPEVSTTARDPHFPHARQWLRRVRGDSVNLLGIVEGDLVHCVDVDEAHYQINTGDVVEVERSRFQGSDLEYSLKQVELTADAILLWPRSTNPRWSKPLQVLEGKTGEDLTVTIKGLVLNVIKPMKRF